MTSADRDRDMDEAAEAARRARIATRIRVAHGDEPADLVLAGGQVVNVLSGEIYPADVAVVGGEIAGVAPPGTYQGRERHDLGGQVLCPALIDGHVHIESSMLLPRDFARAVVPHGTLAVVSDPHEIANVCGLDGIRFMLAAAADLPLDVRVMLSSCVPATDMETAGARLSAADLATLAWDDRGARHRRGDELSRRHRRGATTCCARSTWGCRAGRPVDGHAPNVRGLDIVAYAASGISSDHESFALDEAREKLRLGLHVLVREGSTTRNLDALLPLITPLDRAPTAPSAPTTSTPTTSSARATSTTSCAGPSPAGWTRRWRCSARRITRRATTASATGAPSRPATAPTCWWPTASPTST